MVFIMKIDKEAGVALKTNQTVVCMNIKQHIRQLVKYNIISIPISEKVNSYITKLYILLCRVSFNYVICNSSLHV